MSDYVADTPYVGQVWCPTCEPKRNPLKEVLETRYCDPHTPGRAGKDDASVDCAAFFGAAEAGGDDNIRWCAVIHRDAR